MKRKNKSDYEIKLFFESSEIKKRRYVTLKGVTKKAADKFVERACFTVKGATFFNNILYHGKNIRSKDINLDKIRK